MIIYWPIKQGIQLNYEVANLFFNARKRFACNISNSSQINMPIDILDNNTRKQLFTSVLVELEILVLDIVELDLTVENIRLLNYKLLSDFINKSLSNFMSNFKHPLRLLFNRYDSAYFRLLVFDHQLLLESLLIYFVFGSSSINQLLFPFDVLYTPVEHVSILFDNLIIQISNVIVFDILENSQSLSTLLEFLVENKVCNASYLSIRSLSVFRNNLIAQNLFSFYIGLPRTIYSARYKVWLLSSNGLIVKYIHTSRSEDYLKLSKFQLFFLLGLELQDLLIPRLESFILMLGRILLYLSIKMLGVIIRFFIKTLVSILKNNEK